MKLLLHTIVIITLLSTLYSCSSDHAELQNVETSKSFIKDVAAYSYDSHEYTALELINAHRLTKGLDKLEKINYLSKKSEEHNSYMIANEVVSHDGFISRSESIKKVLSATVVGENIAYNYSTPQSALAAWLASPGHKDNIEGNYTHFGIAITEDPDTGNKYYTNIFAKI